MNGRADMERRITIRRGLVVCMRGGDMEAAADRNPPLHRVCGAIVPRYEVMHSIMSVAYSYKPNE